MTSKRGERNSMSLTGETIVSSRQRAAPSISVVIPVHNVEPFLKYCLDSILSNGANNSPFEVVAVDDASNDGSWKILESYAMTCEQLRLIRFEENRGVSAARNAGVAATRGDYVMFCDPDDAFVPGAIDFVVSVVRDRMPDVFFFKYAPCASQQAIVRSDFKTTTAFYDMGKESSAIKGFERLFSNLWTWNGAFHRRLFSKMRFDERLWPSEDVLWGVHATCQCRTAIASDAILYKYHQRPGSCLHRVFFARTRSEILGIGEFARAAKSWPFYAKVKRIVFKRLAGRAFVRPLSLLRQLPKPEKDAAWDLLFKTYPRAFTNLVPCCLRGLYETAFRKKSRFLVAVVIAGPMRIRPALLNFGFRNRLKAFIRRCRFSAFLV